MKQIHKTISATIILCLFMMVIVAIVQARGENILDKKCSYLDPLLIDFLAFCVAIFLVGEGLARIFEHKNASIKRQFTRILRIMIGFAILTVHVMQVIYKV